MIKELKVNQTVEVILKSDRDRKYGSRVEEYNEEQLLLSMPTSKGVPVIPAAGEKVAVRFLTETAVFEFITAYKDSRMTPLPVWVMKPPTAVERIQQREFVRIRAILSVKARIDGDDGSVSETVVLSKDISGGGVGLVFHESVKVGADISLLIYLPGCEPLATKGKVIRSTEVKRERDEPIYWVAVKYVDMPESVRNRIICFIFDWQRKMRKKRAQF